MGIKINKALLSANAFCAHCALKRRNLKPCSAISLALLDSMKTYSLYSFERNRCMLSAALKHNRKSEPSAMLWARSRHAARNHLIMTTVVDPFDQPPAGKSVLSFQLIVSRVSFRIYGCCPWSSHHWKKFATIALNLASIERPGHSSENNARAEAKNTLPAPRCQP